MKILLVSIGPAILFTIYLLLKEAWPEWLTWAVWHSGQSNEAPRFILGIIVAIIGGGLLFWRTWAANKSANATDRLAKTAEKGHLTDRFSKAVELPRVFLVRIGANAGPAGPEALPILLHALSQRRDKARAGDDCFSLWPASQRRSPGAGY